ncbi:MAG: glycosyltransferase family 4 protein [Terriglobia bacterium]|jgi:glycosyltransferase involved in cell wall biosynthesis
MRITFVLPCYPWRPIGAFRVVYEYANRIVARGHDVAIVHARRLRSASRWEPADLYQKARHAAGRARDALLTPRIRWHDFDERVQLLYVREPTPEAVPDGDAVFVTAWDTVEYVCRYPSQKGKKFHLVQERDLHGDLLEADVQVYVNLVHKVVVSEFLLEEGLRRGWGEMSYIQNGIDRSRFRLVQPVTNRPKTVAMLFSMAARKGSEDGLRALCKAKEKHPDLRAILFGVGRTPPHLPAWIRYYRDPSQDYLVNSIYNGCRIFLSASLTEGFCLPPAEAMACGCAVVTTDCGGNRDYARQGLNALISPPARPELLAQNLIRVLDDDGLRVALAESGSTPIPQLSWDFSTEKLLSLLLRQRNES